VSVLGGSFDGFSDDMAFPMLIILFSLSFGVCGEGRP
jgi:hypothetical protein